VRLYQGGRCSQILKLTPYIYQENHMESALAKFHAFISKRLWGVASQISTHFMHILWNAVPIYTQIIIHISLQLVIQYLHYTEYTWLFEYCSSLKYWNIQCAKDTKMSHFHNVWSVFGGSIRRYIHYDYRMNVLLIMNYECVESHVSAVSLLKSGE